MAPLKRVPFRGAEYKEMVSLQRPILVQYLERALTGRGTCAEP